MPQQPTYAQVVQDLAEHVSTSREVSTLAAELSEKTRALADLRQKLTLDVRDLVPPGEEVDASADLSAEQRAVLMAIRDAFPLRRS